MNKTTSIILTIVLIAGLGIIFFGDLKNNINTASNEATQNTEIKNGIQYVTITINIEDGYLPNISMAKADIPTKLIVKTNGVYGCSAVLVIQEIGFHKTLSHTGKEIIDIGIPKAGESLRGSCGMGIRSFLINFS